MGAEANLVLRWLRLPLRRWACPRREPPSRQGDQTVAAPAGGGMRYTTP